jgi:hypothetical protein
MASRLPFVPGCRTGVATRPRIPPMHWLISLFLIIGAWAPVAAQPSVALKPCRLPGLEHLAQCGTLRRPLDPQQPAGPHIDLHFAVLPALARNRHPDPVFFFAGGPGQSAIDLAGHVNRLLARVANRRDIVLVDQRGTGRSAPLVCDETQPTAPLAEAVDLARTISRLRACRERLERLPHGQLRHYSTPGRHAGRGRRAPGAGRGTHQPRRWQLRHARGAGVHASISPARAPRRSGRAWRRPTWRCRLPFRPTTRPPWMR